MADIFLSYKKDDLDRLRPIISGLEAEGFTVWWDYQIETGTDWWESIVREIGLARAVVGCWTLNSVLPNKAFASNYVDEEHLLGASKLAPALLDSGRIPVTYKNVEAAVLTGWDGSFDHPEWRNLLARVEALATPKWVRRRYAEFDNLKSLEIKRRETAEAEFEALRAQNEQLAAENAQLRLKAQPEVRAGRSAPEEAATSTDTELRAPAPSQRNATWLAGAWLVQELTIVRKGTPLIELHTIVGGDVATIRAPENGMVIQKTVNSHALLAAGALVALFRSQ